MTKQELLQAANDLQAARELLAKHGHTKGNLQDFTTGAMCARGALNRAINGDANTFGNQVRLEVAEDLIRGLIPGGDYHEMAVVLWNNEPERTQAEVESVLAAAASLALSEAC